MIDFTKAIEELNIYKGSEKKKTLIYDNKKYLVKFPDPIREKNRNISYINNAFSEYVGSNIFKLIGFKAQNTVLGKYIYNNKEKIVCGCEDFNDNRIIDVFQVVAAGTELCKAYSELVDPIIQREAFIDQLKAKEQGDEETMEMDESFLMAMEQGMPPISGLGFGIDRLMMLIFNQDSIRDVVLFPLMKPEE